MASLPTMDRVGGGKAALFHDLQQVVELGLDLALFGEQIAQLGALAVLVTGIAGDGGARHGLQPLGRQHGHCLQTHFQLGDLALKTAAKPMKKL